MTPQTSNKQTKRELPVQRRSLHNAAIARLLQKRSHSELCVPLRQLEPLVFCAETKFPDKPCLLATLGSLATKQRFDLSFVPHSRMSAVSARGDSRPASFGQDSENCAETEGCRSSPVEGKPICYTPLFGKECCVCLLETYPKRTERQTAREKPSAFSDT